MHAAVFILALLLRLAGEPVAVPFWCPASAPAQVSLNHDQIGHPPARVATGLLSTSITRSTRNARLANCPLQTSSPSVIHRGTSLSPTSPLRGNTAPTGGRGSERTGLQGKRTPDSSPLARATGVPSTFITPASFQTEPPLHAASPRLTTQPRSLPTAARAHGLTVVPSHVFSPMLHALSLTSLFDNSTCASFHTQQNALVRTLPCLTTQPRSLPTALGAHSLTVIPRTLIVCGPRPPAHPAL